MAEKENLFALLSEHHKRTFAEKVYAVIVEEREISRLDSCAHSPDAFGEGEVTEKRGN